MREQSRHTRCDTISREWDVPELSLCVYCKKPINPEVDLYVKAEPAAQDSREFGKPIVEQYAHAKCCEMMQDLESQTSRK